MRNILVIFLAVFCLSSNAQDNAEQIFIKATNQLLGTDLELALDVQITDAKGRVKEKGFNLLMATVNGVDKTKIVIEKPERAKGVTIIITDFADKEGQIEVFTPANGKIRKMKATPENMALVGFDFFLADYSSVNNEDIRYKLLTDEEFNGIMCHKLEIKSKTDATGDVAELLIDKLSLRIMYLRMYNAEMKEISNTELSDYQPIKGVKGKLQPMLILTNDLLTKKQSKVQVQTAQFRSDINESEFNLDSLVGMSDNTLE